MDAEQVFDLEARVLAARAIERRSWVWLADALDAFHANEAWKALGYERFTDWLGVPEVGLGRRTAYRLLQAWRWGAAQGVSPEALERVELTKLTVVIPAVEDGRVSAQEAISDAEVLSRSDLLEKYGGGRTRAEKAPTAEELLQACPDCGCRRLVDAA